MTPKEEQQVKELNIMQAIKCLMECDHFVLFTQTGGKDDENSAIQNIINHPMHIRMAQDLEKGSLLEAICEMVELTLNTMKNRFDASQN